MDFVWITHPDIEIPALVPETAVPHYTGHGWSLKEDTPPPPEVGAPSEPVSPVDTTKPTRGRRGDSTEE